ncbi:MAG: AmmeMemoRadiSam system radical SAM enzyme [Melioribacteraceae bacterium]|nr:AmmeMemoRadiSam system radical SAM enzyme [Melioribacteraceae bacterium]
MNTSDLIIAKWWKPIENNRILCTLCPRYCKLGEGQNGFCYVRKNVDGKLVSLSYGRPTGFAVDPIEKKPLNHFYPGTSILSFGTAGCNLGCKFCQNWSISKSKSDNSYSLHATAEDVVKIAKKHKTPSIAFTYNDPIVFGEFVIDVSKLARREGIKTVLVTNGYITEEAREEVYQYIDAANVDLKAFSSGFYKKLTLSKIENVLDTLVWIKNKTNIWLEITTLLIPGENDSPEEITNLCKWVYNNLGSDVPIHFTAFHPDYKLVNKEQTPGRTLDMARDIAIKTGLNYCYVGNVHNPKAQTTYCPSCNKSLITRTWHSVLECFIENDKCIYCGTEIAGRY